MPKARDAAYMERWRRVKKGRGERGRGERGRWRRPGSSRHRLRSWTYGNL